MSPSTEEGRLTRLENDVYYGNGRDNPSLTTRMALMEDVISKLNDNLKWFVRITVASMMTAIGSIAVAVILYLQHVKR